MAANSSITIAASRMLVARPKAVCSKIPKAKPHAVWPIITNQPIAKLHELKTSFSNVITHRLISKFCTTAKDIRDSHCASCISISLTPSTLNWSLICRLLLLANGKAPNNVPQKWVITAMAPHIMRTAAVLSKFRFAFRVGSDVRLPLLVLL